MTNDELIARVRENGERANESLWRLVWDNGMPWTEAKPKVDEAWQKWRKDRDSSCLDLAI